MAGTHLMKRIPLIKFPQRHPKPAGSGSSPPADQKVFSRFGGRCCRQNDNWTSANSNVGAGSAASQPEPSSTAGERPSYRFRSDVPAPPAHTAMGGKASLLPKRTPLTEKEIEAIVLGGCF